MTYFLRHLGCIVVPVEVTLSNLQITEFNPSGKMFSLEEDFPLYFPIAKILSIKQIPKENIGALSYDEALQDLSCSTIDYLYAISSSNLDMQILNLYKQMEEETSKINDECIKQTYNTMLQTNNDNVFISLRSSSQITADNEVAKLFIQDYNIVGYSYDPKSESSIMRAEEKLRIQRMF